MATLSIVAGPVSQNSVDPADERIRRILIVGGGTAGWMAAARLVHSLGPLGVEIRLVESGQIGTVGVGEATVPPIIDFVRQLDIDEDALMRETKATFKLGIAYRDWTRERHDYFHPFGPIGAGLGAVSFPAYWLRMHLAGKAARLEAYSVQSRAAAAAKFTRPVHAPGTPLNKIVYALHFDASLFARYLRKYAEARGVVRTEGNVQQVALRGDGFIDTLTLDSGEQFSADLFIDCSGFHARLIGDALRVPFDDWSRWLPCDRALVMQTASAAPPPPYTLVTARDAGWQWGIPLQHRVGNGHVYSSAFMSDDAACEVLLANVEGARRADPTVIQFAPGRRLKAWSRNCIALGLSAGFLEPLEATSIHLIQRGLAMLLKFFPSRRFETADIDRFNKVMDFEFARVRDFLVLHYTQTERRGPFWAHCRDISLPDSLHERIDLFRGHGRILREDAELFPIQSWLSVMIGQNLTPRSYDPITDGLDAARISAKLSETALSVQQCVDAMPAHADYIAAHCEAAAP